MAYDSIEKYLSHFCGVYLACVGMYRARLDNLSTAVIIESYPFETGGPTIKSIDTISQHSCGTGMGMSLPMCLRLLDFHLMHVSHVDTYSITPFPNIGQ